MKPILLPVSFFAAAMLTAAASAQDVPAPRGGARMIHRVEARLGLSAEQIAQAKVILQQERPALESIHMQLAAEHSELAKLTTADAAQTEAIVAKYASANTSAVVERQKLRVELTAILTPTQQQKLEQIRARFGAAVDERLLTLGDNL
jgi:Spy/CpxP family protein refolding chaperone